MLRSTQVTIATAVLFLALLAIYGFSPVRTSFDSRWAVPTAMSLLRGHGGSLAAYAPVIAANDDYAIDPDLPEPRTVYPIGASLLAVPAVAIAAALDPTFEPRLRDHVPDKLEHWIASVIGAIAATLFFWLLRTEYRSNTDAVAGTVLFALGSTMWSNATRALWQHGPLVLCLVIAMLLFQRARQRPSAAAYAGLPLAAAYLMRPTAAVPILFLTIYVLLYYRNLFPRFIVLACLIGLPWLLFNLKTTGHLLEPYYVEVTGNTPAPIRFPFEGLVGSLFSPARGLLIFTPAFVLAIPGFFISLKDPVRRSLNLAYGAIILGMFGVVAHWAVWWGGHAYGPRLLTDMVPFLALFATEAMHYARRQRLRGGAVICGSLLLASVALQAPGALSNRAWLWNVNPDNVDRDTARLWDWHDPQFLRAIR